ncbi:hypothetical protein PRZ48_007227 [Zasmidium cellare]|uniref:Uncharacterized protein n=1 Tax=Zasmidium cellare TaxID=395010 RepID=A0ABR0EJV7_ZASCE|nr:hypothetical protein PRZ48_007227 [Zasmidium cellare]
MLSSILPTLALLLSLLSFTTAAPTADNDLALDTRQSDYTWHISQFQARCANGVCHYQIVIEAGRQGEIPGFMATCVADNVPRANKDFRNCSVNRGNLEGVQSVKAFVELRPRRPNVETRMVVEMGFNDRASGGSTVTYWRGRQTGTYQTFRDLSQAGSFDVVPFKYAAVA